MAAAREKAMMAQVCYFVSVTVRKSEFDLCLASTAGMREQLEQEAAAAREEAAQAREEARMAQVCWFIIWQIRCI